MQTICWQSHGEQSTKSSRWEHFVILIFGWISLTWMHLRVDTFWFLSTQNQITVGWRWRTVHRDGLCEIAESNVAVWGSDMSRSVGQCITRLYDCMRGVYGKWIAPYLNLRWHFIHQSICRRCIDCTMDYRTIRWVSLGQMFTNFENHISVGLFFFVYFVFIAHFSFIKHRRWTAVFGRGAAEEI